LVAVTTSGPGHSKAFGCTRPVVFHEPGSPNATTEM
jgi:hypothetical protein